MKTVKYTPAFSSYKVGEPSQIARASKIVHTMDDLETQHLRFYERVFNNHFTWAVMKRWHLSNVWCFRGNRAASLSLQSERFTEMSVAVQRSREVIFASHFSSRKCDAPFLALPHKPTTNTAWFCFVNDVKSKVTRFISSADLRSPFCDEHDFPTAGRRCFKFENACILSWWICTWQFSTTK